jgi:hypothetical protein
MNGWGHWWLTSADWVPYHNDMADAMGWVYGGWGRRMQLANEALGACDEAAP